MQNHAEQAAVTATAGKINLLGLSREKMEAFFQGLGEKPFRAVQIMKWLHQRGVTDFEAMTDISKRLRETLAERAEIRIPRIKNELAAADGCYKWIMEVASGSGVEMVYIPERDRGTLCVSSQAGCSLDCTFCATGKQGFNSNLTAGEIVAQLWLAGRRLTALEGNGPGKITNVVMMGMGEPLLNFDNVMDAVSIMMDDNCYGLSKRKVTISTSGVVPAIDRMHEHTDASIAVSLHAPNDALRTRLVPLNRKYPIAALLDSVRGYLNCLSDSRPAVIEYILIAGVNDHRAHARELAALLRTLPCKINLIPFNPFEGTQYRRSSNAAVSNFRRILQEAGYTVTVRTTRGEDIAAACGQLVGQVDDTTRRHARFVARREQSTPVQHLKVE